MDIELGLRRKFNWHFIIADVDRSIIGFDFLVHYGLLFDPRHNTLVTSETLFTSFDETVDGHSESIQAIYGDTVYHRLPAKFPDIYPAAGINNETKHNVKYYIETTLSSPIYCRPRRFAPDRLKAVKAEFEDLMQQGIIRPLKSP